MRAGVARMVPGNCASARLVRPLAVSPMTVATRVGPLRVGRPHEPHCLLYSASYKERDGD